ncbi:MAG: hypothetical protein AAGA99_06735 [Actinomycetota bacterium]
MADVKRRGAWVAGAALVVSTAGCSGTDAPVPLPEVGTSPCDEVVEHLRADDLDAALERLRIDGLTVRVPDALLDLYAVAGYACQSRDDMVVVSYAIGLADPDSGEVIAFVESVGASFLGERRRQLDETAQAFAEIGPGSLIRPAGDPPVELASVEFDAAELADPIEVLAALAAILRDHRRG